MNDPICKTERNLRCGDMVVINGDYMLLLVMNHIYMIISNKWSITILLW